MLAAVLFCAGGVLGLGSAAKADSPQSIASLVRYLEKELSFNTDEIARLLLQYPAKWERNTEPRLARWQLASLKVTILSTGDARADVSDFIANMGSLGSMIGRHVEYCVRPISVPSDEAYAPSLDDIECLRKPSDLVLLVDNSPTPSRALYRDLRSRATLPEEARFWGARETSDLLPFQKTSCEVRTKLDLETSALSSATAYFRVVDRGTDYKGCVLALPFLIFGQLPIAKADGHQELVPELLELLYSPSLQPGMSEAEIKRRLEE
jgi:hypothetical protein